jgi:hypothetical protein
MYCMGIFCYVFLCQGKRMCILFFVSICFHGRVLLTICKLYNYAPSRPIFKRKKNKHNLHTPWNPYYILFIFWRLNLNILTWTFCRIYCFMRYLKGIQCHITTGFCGLSTYFTIHTYSQTCIKRSPLGSTKSDFIKQVIS